MLTSSMKRTKRKLSMLYSVETCILEVASSFLPDTYEDYNVTFDTAIWDEQNGKEKYAAGWTLYPELFDSQLD